MQQERCPRCARSAGVAAVADSCRMTDVPRAQLTLAPIAPIDTGKTSVLWHATDRAGDRWLVKVPRDLRSAADLAAREYLGDCVARALGLEVPALVIATLVPTDQARVGAGDAIVVARQWIDLDVQYRAASWDGLAPQDRAALLVYTAATGADFDVVRIDRPRDVYVDASGHACVIDLESVSVGSAISRGDLRAGPAGDETRPVLRRNDRASLDAALAELDAIGADDAILSAWSATLRGTFNASIEMDALRSWLRAGSNAVRIPVQRSGISDIAAAR